MEHQLPVALQVVLYVVSAAIVVFVVVAIPLLFRLQRQLERAVSSIEEIKTETKPLARETRELVDELRGLSGRASRIVDEVGSVVEPPLLASSMGFRLIRTGVKTFVRALWNGTREQQRKARWV
jgi:mannitol-specific phosphotransferase system IIBC component